MITVKRILDNVSKADLYNIRIFKGVELFNTAAWETLFHSFRNELRDSNLRIKLLKNVDSFFRSHLNKRHRFDTDDNNKYNICIFL